MIPIFKKPTCALCNMTEPRGKEPQEITFVVFANHKEYSLCHFCCTLVRSDRQLINTRFPAEYADTPGTRRKWLIQEFNRLNPLDTDDGSNEPDLLLRSDEAGEPGFSSTHYMTSCPACGEKVDVHECMGGETIDCPKCGGPVELPLDHGMESPGDTAAKDAEITGDNDEEQNLGNTVKCAGCGHELCIVGGESAQCPGCGEELDAPLDFAD